MYALIVPASTPFVLLATVMALAWWEDHILPTPPTEPDEAPAEPPFPRRPQHRSQNSSVSTPR
ncbi:hypothetical protein [Streptomyces viridochromogenes]|uniref:hypothetical protein n=1 Tax=Streptomyces viridochromogenes TaxID=1938 RepID=UPI000A4E29B8|nr:hypothetical protein [Streptomyces viridochromogenes]